ncbi:hypothetical protein C5S29_00425 [ANME-1 cluster archaeon GoMg3.2]|nr:hypothetical protein [ANME-1 cluster archaeon GoMg3.2]
MLKSEIERQIKHEEIEKVLKEIEEGKFIFVLLCRLARKS